MISKKIELNMSFQCTICVDTDFSISMHNGCRNKAKLYSHNYIDYLCLPIASRQSLIYP